MKKELSTIATALLIATITGAAAILWNLNGNVLVLSEKITALSAQVTAQDQRVRVLEARR